MNKKYLIESTINKLRGLDKRKLYFDERKPGLVLIVQKQKLDQRGNDISKKSWLFNYRPRGSKPVRLLLGDANQMSRSGAINRIKKIENDIFNNEDPFIVRKKMKAEHSLETLIYEFYRLVLLPSTYSDKYIRCMKSLFNVWIFQKPENPKLFTQYFTYSIKHKKISKIKTRDVLEVFNSAKSKSGYSANRLVAYLKVVFNWAISEKILIGPSVLV